MWAITVTFPSICALPNYENNSCVITMYPHAVKKADCGRLTFTVQIDRKGHQLPTKTDLNGEPRLR